MRRFAFVLALVPVLLVGCATYQLQPLAQDGVTLKQDREKSLAVVTRDGVTFEVWARWEPDLQFEMTVTNASGRTIELDSNTFRLFDGDLKKWNEIGMISSEAVYARSTTQVVAGTVLVALSGLGNDTTYQRRTTTSTSVISTGRGSSVVITRTENHSVPVQTSNGLVESVAKDGQEHLESLKEKLFYAVTLEPDKSYTGLLYGNTGRGDYYKLVVPLEGKDLALIFEKVRVGRGPFVNIK